MKKRTRITLGIFLSVLLLCGTIFAFAADDNPIVRSGQTYQGDMFTGGNSVTNDGIINGDLIGISQILSVRGDVAGDIIAIAPDINVSGKVGGSVRIGGNNVNLSGTVERNVMAYGSNLIISQNSNIKKNLYAFGNSVSIAGTVGGKSNIYASSVTLNGTFEGDVTLNDMTEGTSLNIQSGTVIKGKLTYKGVNEYQVPSGVTVGSYEYIKINPVSKGQVEVKFNPWSYVKKLFTLIVYYLIALLLYKLFPRFFVRSGDFIGEKPLSAAGIGIATLGSLVGGLLLLILILILTIFIFKATIFMVAGFIFMFIAMLTIVFADIPVSLWLGKLMGRNNVSVPARLAIGLALITLVKWAFELLSNIHAIGTLIGVLSFILNAAIWILGTGAMLKVIFEIFKSANTHAEIEAEENAIEPLNF